MAVFYFAAWTDSGCLCGSDHQHQTVLSAMACINTAGGYVVAVETRSGLLRELTDAEEAEFQLAKYAFGAKPQAEKAPKGRSILVSREISPFLLSKRATKRMAG
jgi:hypothetical protein